jgi:DNA-directed RNA polymerase subunit RPC12/RpoP
MTLEYCPYCGDRLNIPAPWPGMTHRCEECGRRFPVDDDVVGESLACPVCGENRIAHLLWQDDDRMKCDRCGDLYRP